VINVAQVRNFCGRNIAVATCRRNVLKQHGCDQFWPKRRFQVYKDLCPTEHVFFTLNVLVRRDGRCFDVFTGNEVSRDDFEKMRQIQCVGFVPIVLLYVCDGKGSSQLTSCYIDGLATEAEETTDAVGS
jgi:hypothetical protein